MASAIGLDLPGGSVLGQQLSNAPHRKIIQPDLDGGAGASSQPRQIGQGMLAAGGPTDYLQPFFVSGIGGGADLGFELCRLQRTHRQFGSFSCDAQACSARRPFASHLYIYADYCKEFV